MWKNVRRIDGSDGSVAKFVFEGESAVAESVLYQYPTYEERTVMCISTQSGCPIGCRFCGAGDSFVRSLTAEEIVSQPVHLFEAAQVDPASIERLQIMFMSMGEPLLNLTNVTYAIERLHALYPHAALLLSTSAPDVDYAPLWQISKHIDKVGLQFSVHESTDEARDQLVPFKKKLPLAEIAIKGQNWHVATGRRPFFNYCAHEGNTSAADADRLLALFDPTVWEATISVVCERDESVRAANERQRALAASFRSQLGARGFSTRVFDPAGQDDVGGGCGQLWFVQSWMKDHPTLSKPSAGRKLPVLHAPGRNASP